MAYIKVMPKGYKDNTADYDVIHYICNPDKAISHQIGAMGALNNTVENMVNGFQAIRQVNHVAGGRHLRHMIVSFSEDDDVTLPEAFHIGYLIASYYADKHQIVFSVHENTSHLHIHFVMNTVSYIDGSKFSPSPKEKEIILNIIEQEL